MVLLGGGRRFLMTEVPRDRRLAHRVPRVSDTPVYEPYIRARLGTAANFCEVVVLTRHRGQAGHRVPRARPHPPTSL